LLLRSISISGRNMAGFVKQGSFSRRTGQMTFQAIIKFAGPAREAPREDRQASISLSGSAAGWASGASPASSFPVWSGKPSIAIAKDGYIHQDLHGHTSQAVIFGLQVACTSC
jgi:hypothetical protein